MRSTFLLALLFLNVSVSPAAAQTFLENVPDSATYVPGQVLVRMRNNAPMLGPRLRALGLDTTVARTGGSEYLYRIPPTTIAAMGAGERYTRTMQVVDSLRADPNVEWAQPNYRVYIVGRTAPLRDLIPTDPRWGEQWHYRNNGSASSESPGGINLPKAWDAGTGSNSINVSILDTGILPNHPDIVGSPNLVAGYDMISDALSANDGGGRDTNPTDPGDAVSAGECGGGQPPVDFPSSWHGTHVSGTVGVGNTNNTVGVAGVNWRVNVQPVRVLGKCGGTTADINDGIRWAAGLPVPGVPSNATPARVISMSLGAAGLPCSLSPSTQSAIDDARAAGAIVVVAAGNEASDAANAMPASCNGVVTVAASDERGVLATRYSNFGSTVEIMAPGGDTQRDDDGNGQPDGVLSMVQGGYAYYNGTSMATPHVSGVIALWLSQTPTISNDSVLKELYARALPRTSAQCPRACGAGLLNANRTSTVMPPPTMVTVTLNPDTRYDVGETAIVTATVRAGTQLLPGKTVTFVTGDPAIATVSPTSNITNASGVATTTLTALARGGTDVTATVDGVTGTSPIRVPSTSTIALAALLALMLAIGLTRLRRRKTEPAQ
jgi:serine protease